MFIAAVIAIYYVIVHNFLAALMPACAGFVC
jgi:hypothetical protein